MKTYLTGEQFTDTFFRLFGDRMSRYNKEQSTCDGILYRLFQCYEKDVKETLEGSMWGIDEFTGENANELIGYQFHKSFRQVDVISDPNIDSIIWSCIQDAPVFWKCMEKACRILTNEELAKDYEDAEWL